MKDSDVLNLLQQLNLPEKLYKLASSTDLQYGVIPTFLMRFFNNYKSCTNCYTDISV